MLVRETDRLQHSQRIGQWQRTRRVLLTTLPLVATLASCDRIKRQLAAENAVETAPAGDPAWQRDSAFLASNPKVVFRLVDRPQGRIASPVASISSRGFRTIRLSPRGWKAFDVNFTYKGNTLTSVSRGSDAGRIEFSRGMWESGTTLDSLPQCKRVVPAGLLIGRPSSTLAVANLTPSHKPVPALSSGELQDAVSSVPTLIAPPSGISPSFIGRYKREVFQVPTGVSNRPSIVLTLNDPEVVADSLARILQRPRQLVVVLDRGVYGYRPSFKFTTVGNAKDNPKMYFLDALDIDGDGKSELFFGVFNKDVEGTIVLRHENDAWREVFRETLRCQG
jgi:hypothetical protein